MANNERFFHFTWCSTEIGIPWVEMTGDARRRNDFFFRHPVGTCSLHFLHVVLKLWALVIPLDLQCVE